MLSIKRLLEEDGPDGINRIPVGPAQRLTQAIVQAISRQTMEFNRFDTGHFRAQMERFAERLERPLDPGEMQVLGDALMEALPAYHSRFTLFLSHSSTEFHAMVTMLSDAIAELAGGCDQTVSKLKEIEGRMALACEIEDIRELRGELRNCLSELKLERARQEVASSPCLRALRDRVNQAAGAYILDPAVDDCTGLPCRAMAVRDMSENSTSSPGLQRYAAIFVVDRVEMVKMRFGGEVGDELLLTFAQELAQVLTPADRCYRWTGPALLVILERTHSLAVVRAEMARMLPQKGEKTFHVGNRSVLIPVSSCWTVAPLPGKSLPETVLRLDSFVAEHAPESQHT